MEEKVVNDAAAYIISIAQAHGRNMEWAEKAVRESVSATEQEALKLKVIDMVAPNLDSLISQLDGRQVTMLGGAVVTERIFAWPGMGRLFWEHAGKSDYPVLMAILLLISLCVVAFQLLTDVCYTWLDPRIRYS
jgi:membrane-bound ClpP family serine protease